MDDDSPDDVVHREFARQVFEGHPSGRDTAGERATVVSLTADEVRGFHARALPRRQHRRRRRRRSRHRRDPPRRRPRVRGVPVRRRLDPARRPRARSARARRSSDDTEQVHLIVGGRALPRLRPRPGGARHRQPRVRRWIVEPVVRRDPRASRPGLQRVLGHASYSDAGAWSIYAGTMPAARRHGADADRRGARRASSPTASPTRSWRSPRAS